MKRVAALLLLLVLSFGAGAQHIKGAVLDGKDGAGVPYANVAVLRTADSSFVSGTSTGADGSFVARTDTAAECMLRVSAIGYATQWVVLAATGTDGPVKVMLREGATTLDAIEISAVKPMYAADGEKRIYNVSEDPTIQNGTAQDALQNAPGVQVDGEGNITLNGKEVTVYINDRESHYTGEMLKQYIKTLTADQISAIEVMEYPPAKYGGGGPVVNIRTEQNLRRNSYVSFGAQGSSRPEVSPFVSYAYANEKLRFDAYMRYSRNVRESHSSDEGVLLNEDSTLVGRYSSADSSRNVGNNMNLSFSLGYDFDSMNTLSAYINFSPQWGRSQRGERAVRSEMVGGAMSDFGNYGYGEDTSGYMWGYGNVSFEHKFNNDGHQISFGVSGYGGGSMGTNRGTSFRHYDLQPQMSYDQRTLSRYGYYDVDVDVDYSFPYSDKGEFSAGLGFSLSGDDNYYQRDTLDHGLGAYRIDALRSDTSISGEPGANLYLSWRRKLGNFTLRLGGTMNYTRGSNRHTWQPEYDTVVNHLTFTPSVTLLYNTPTMHSFSLNYRVSTNMPSASSLSRYVSYGNTDSYSTGNPDLEPYYRHNLGMGYDKYFAAGHSIGISGSYTVELGEVGRISMPTYSDFFGRYVMFTMPYNAGDSRKGSIYAYARWRPTAVFNMTLSANVEDSWYRIMLHPGEYFEDRMAGWSSRLSARAKVFNLVWVSLSGYYNSRQHGWSAMEVSEPRWGMDFGASADLLDRKLSFYVNVSDIFNTANWNSSSINPYATSSSTYTYNSRYITFGVTLRFGKMELGNSGREGIQESSGGGKK